MYEAQVNGFMCCEVLLNTLVKLREGHVYYLYINTGIADESHLIFQLFLVHLHVI